MEKCKTFCETETVELDKLNWFRERRPSTEARKNIYIMTMVSRKPQQIVGHVVSADISSPTPQQMVDAAPEAQKYRTNMGIADI